MIFIRNCHAGVTALTKYYDYDLTCPPKTRVLNKGVVPHICDPRIWRLRDCDIEARLVYIRSSRPVYTV